MGEMRWLASVLSFISAARVSAADASLTDTSVIEGHRKKLMMRRVAHEYLDGAEALNVANDNMVGHKGQITAEGDLLMRASSKKQAAYGQALSASGYAPSHVIAELLKHSETLA